MPVGVVGVRSKGMRECEGRRGGSGVMRAHHALERCGPRVVARRVLAQPQYEVSSARCRW